MPRDVASGPRALTTRGTRRRLSHSDRWAIEAWASQRRLRAQVRCDRLVVRADRVIERRAAPAIDPVHIGARLPLGYTHLGA